MIWPHTAFSQCRSMCVNNIHFLAQESETRVLNSSHEQISQKRGELFDTINGEILYAMRHWPNSMERMFWKKPLSDEETFTLCLFLYSNGCPPEIIVQWILTSNFWNTANIKKRRHQIRPTWIFDNMSNQPKSFGLFRFKSVFIFVYQ